MSLRSKVLISIASAIFLQIVPASAQNLRNLILFVPDGLRPHSVTPETAPALAAVRDAGVNFANPHPWFPPFTLLTASGMPTGHFLATPGPSANRTNTPYPAPPHGATE